MQFIEYKPSANAIKVLIKGKILAPNETPQQMFNRVVKTLFDIETVFNTSIKDTKKAREKFAFYVSGKYFIPGTPTLTNAGRHEYSALSSCAIIPVDLRKKSEATKLIKAYYKQNMGSGFDLTPYKNPIELLLWLNDMAEEETKSNKYDRYIGNMANLHISHPSIHNFIVLKKNHRLPHFNCSVVIDDKFMTAVIKNGSYYLSDGKKENAREVLLKISESAWKIGDPSIINLDRMNKDNPISNILPYISAPPCAEMGLSKGETCQFIYINISKFCTPTGINYELLKDAVNIVVRALDNAVEYGITRYPSQTSSSVARLKRKIGIAVSGIADTFLYYNLPYASKESLSLVRDVVSFINYISKCASIKLGQIRGSCGAMKNKRENLYYHDYLVNRYNFSTKTISKNDWLLLNNKIKESGYLRNILTITQPPAARVSLLMDCSFGIEPIFGIPDQPDAFPEAIVSFVKKYSNGNSNSIIQQASKEGSFQNTNLPLHAKQCLKTATEILPLNHIKMVAVLAGTKGVIDETASKTVNLPKTATVDDVYQIFLFAHKKGLKNISIYRDGSHENQPYKL